MQQVYLWYIVVVQIESLLQRIVTNKRFILLILNNFVSQNLEVRLKARCPAFVRHQGFDGGVGRARAYAERHGGEARQMEEAR